MEARRPLIVPELERDEFLSWESRQAERFELHHGFVVSFAGGTVAHATIAHNLQFALARAFPRPCAVFGSDLKIEVSRDTYFYPDASVVCEPLAAGDVVARKPTLVAEVLSPSTAAYDLIEKRAAYRTIESLRSYLSVSTTERRVEFDARTSRGWQTQIITDGSFPLGEAAVSIHDLYFESGVA